jgi:hypothetical protein
VRAHAVKVAVLCKIMGHVMTNLLIRVGHLRFITRIGRKQTKKKQTKQEDKTENGY